MQAAVFYIKQSVNIFPRRVSVVLEVSASQSQLEPKWEPAGQATDKSFADISELERIL